MCAAPIPEHEGQRLEALQDSGLWDRPPQERFSRLTRLAQRLPQGPIGRVSVVAARRRWSQSYRAWRWRRLRAMALSAPTRSSRTEEASVPMRSVIRALRITPW